MMLPTFPRIVAFRQQENLKFLKARIGVHSPIHQQIRSHIQHEGRQAQIVRQGDDPDPTEFVEASAEVQVKRVPLREFKLNDVAEIYDGAAKQFALQQSEMLVNKLHEVTAKTGNVVDSGGSKLSADLILQVYETIEMSFSEDGEWQPPTFWGGTSASEAFSRIMADPEFQSQLTTLVGRKRSEFRRREANRVLAG